MFVHINKEFISLTKHRNLGYHIPGVGFVKGNNCTENARFSHGVLKILYIVNTVYSLDTNRENFCLMQLVNKLCVLSL